MRAYFNCPVNLDLPNDYLKRLLSDSAARRDMGSRERGCDWRFTSPHGLILHYGRYWMSRTKPKGVKWGRKGECFSNAFYLMARCPWLTYCEGYALLTDLPLEFLHAWCVDQEGNVIDNTWRKPSTEYFGIPFDRDWVLKFVRDKEESGVLLEYDEMFNAEWLKNGIPAHAIAVGWK